VPKFCFIEKTFLKKSLALITQVNDIIADYEAQGYSLTLRQVYYQLVSRNVIENSEKSYDNLGVLICNGRLGGLIDWGAIEDRTRELHQFIHWDNPNERIQSAARSYRIDLWQDQDCYVETWVEKEALADVVATAADRYDVPSFACKGYPSVTAMYDAAHRMNLRRDRHCVILYLGDHDPSGTDMSGNVERQMRTFRVDVEVRRIALNMSQIEKYNPPPQPAKKSDRRTPAYIEKYGIATSWELDALEPAVLDELISENILSYLDVGKYEQMEIRQAEERERIYRITT